MSKITDNEKSFFALGGIICTTMVLMIISIPMSAWSFNYIWALFAPSVFGLPLLSASQAYLIILLVTMMTHQKEAPADKDQGTGAVMFGMLARATIKPVFYVLLALMVNKYM